VSVTVAWGVVAACAWVLVPLMAVAFKAFDVSRDIPA
jgi:hypothetical protein